MLLPRLRVSDICFGESDRVRKYQRRHEVADLLGGFQHSEFLRNLSGMDSVVLPAEVFLACVVHVPWSLEWYNCDL